MERIRKLPSPAMIIAVIAVILALGGTAVGAKKLGLGKFRNSVKDKTVMVRVAENVKIEYERSGIATVSKKSDVVEATTA